MVVLVELAAVALAAADLARLPWSPDTGQLALGAVGLAALGVLHTELATGIERVRRRVSHLLYFDLSTVWTFAAALLLPPGMAGLVVVVVYGHLWWRVWRPAGAPLYRHVYTTATVVLAAMAASVVVSPEALTAAAGTGGGSRIIGYLSLLLAMAVYGLINQLLVATALALSAPDRPGWRRLVGDWDDHILEGSTLCLAVLAALAAQRQVLLVLLVLPPLLVLHRAVLIRQLEERANTDAKTNLLTAVAWRGRAHRALARARRQRGAVAVLILDLDHFKAVNDGYGHLAGDEVLSAVAGTLKAQVRDVDPVGRFGGEEFVVLLAGLPVGASPSATCRCRWGSRWPAATASPWTSCCRSPTTRSTRPSAAGATRSGPAATGASPAAEAGRDQAGSDSAGKVWRPIRTASRPARLAA
ncbi:GGDEF domain-containing protein [Pseudonocardia sp. ICBG1293]|uniref:GGDEF domain-containing protein n=1 Tax=Pseudonocardia sp. ICBG1293 TaxID=2844382 RepID=UPI001CCB2022|nr:GGDEF domain-containing protein [Pseudonocardia sp. ICBG1293]